MEGRLGRNNKGTLSFFAMFIAVSIVIIISCAIFIPFIVDFIYKSYTTSQEIMSMGEEEINKIENQSVKRDLYNSYNATMESTSFQITILQNFYRYSWLIVIIIISLVAYVSARRLVEYEGRGGVI